MAQSSLRDLAPHVRTSFPHPCNWMSNCDEDDTYWDDEAGWCSRSGPKGDGIGAIQRALALGVYDPRTNEKNEANDEMEAKAYLTGSEPPGAWTTCCAEHWPGDRATKLGLTWRANRARACAVAAPLLKDLLRIVEDYDDYAPAFVSILPEDSKAAARWTECSDYTQSWTWGRNSESFDGRSLRLSFHLSITLPLWQLCVPTMRLSQGHSILAVVIPQKRVAVAVELVHSHKTPVAGFHDVEHPGGTIGGSLHTQISRSSETLSKLDLSLSNACYRQSPLTWSTVIYRD